MSDRTVVEVYPHHSRASHATTHLVIGSESERGILIDPVRLDRDLFELFQRESIVITDVLITRYLPYMERGLRTLARIYPVTVHAGEIDAVFDLPLHRIVDRTEFAIGDLGVEAIPAAAHSGTSLFYVVAGMLFTGAIIHAGTLGAVEGAYAETMLIATVEELFERLGDETIIVPSIGPPTTVRAERLLSPFYSTETTAEQR